MNWIAWPVLESPYELLFLAAKASVPLGLGIAASAIMTRTAASSRYFIISLAIFLAAGLPILSPIFPAWKLPVPVMLQSHLVKPNPVTPSAEETVKAAGIKPKESHASLEKAGIVDKRLPRPSLILCVWLIGTVVTAGRVSLGLLNCFRTGHRGPGLPGAPHWGRAWRLAQRSSRAIGLDKTVAIRLSDRAHLPHVTGLFKPVIILPQEAADWSTKRLKVVLIHELAHIRRRDHITWPLANLAVSWLWFNPLVWVALARMRREREKACDDWVLASVKSGVTYARHLLDICASLRTPLKPAPIGLMFAHRNELEERITYMLKRNTGRRPMMNLQKRLALALLLVLAATPLLGINGFRADTTRDNVSPDERSAILATLAEFYFELSSVSDYESLRGRFLTEDYFKDPALTLENLDEAVKRIAFDNTISLLTESGVSPAKEVHGRVVSIHREGREYVVTQHLDVVAQRIVGATAFENEDGDVIIKSGASSGQPRELKECRLVNALGHQLRFRKEDGFFKISKFDDGVALMRMDTNNPYGPIFLFWMDDIDPETTPFGPGVFKVIPLDIVPSATNTKFVLEK
jgi:beta-lactamase regulating signal transducer with metallopeptidase domain